jgi:hypothetical protein
MDIGLNEAKFNEKLQSILKALNQCATDLDNQSRYPERTEYNKKLDSWREKIASARLKICEISHEIMAENPSICAHPYIHAWGSHDFCNICGAVVDKQEGESEVLK